MTSSSPKAQRIATIEIGSRAVRMLVAEISESEKLRVLTSDWRETALAAALASGGATLETKITELVTVVQSFREKARSFSLSRMCIFATEAVRQMSEADLAKLHEGIPELEIIDRKMEASCSLLGALSPFNTPKPTKSSFVIDQGSGSMELAVGAIGISGVELTAYKSYRLGTQELTADLREFGGDLRKLRSKLNAQVKSLKLLEVDPTLKPIVLGSAATKIAWMMVRKNATDRYDPAKVHDRFVDLAVIDKLVEMAIAAPAAIRGAIDPANPNSSEFETVITGLMSISTFLSQLGKPGFQVSAFGPRYGVIWMAGIFRKLGVDE